MVRITKIPCDESIPLTEEEMFPPSAGGETTCMSERGGDVIPNYLKTHMKEVAEESTDIIIDTTPLIRMTHPTANHAKPSESFAGLYAYSISTTSISTTSQSVSCSPNIRATRLAMACGRHSHRFVGDVWIGRLGYLPNQTNDGNALMNLDLPLTDIRVGCELSPDLRSKNVVDMMQQNTKVSFDIHVPDWMGNASQKKYHDGASLAALAGAMTRADVCSDEDDSDQEDSSSSSSGSSDSSPLDKRDKAESETANLKSSKPSLTEITLCLHCRGPATVLCEGCGGAYFCEEPRKCKLNGWSHQCLCSTWKIYVQHRSLLSSFPFLSGWQLPLLQEDCFSSETTYQHFLANVLGVMKPLQSLSTTEENKDTQQNWWATELHGWSGGASRSSKDVNPFHRVSYEDGFALKDKAWIPAERHVTKNDIEQANATYREDGSAISNDVQLIHTDEHGFPILTSWEHYYRLRSLPPSSPAGLLATFPLTVYYAIQHHGAVPLTVAQMLERPLRIHVVGIEKELNFVDLFKELGFLVPKNVAIDMTWVVREDMFPENRDGRHLTLQLTSNLRLSIIGGTYGESLNPDFDMGGPPDMVIGMNAGLFAYESWRHVISYLHHNQNVVGVFTDYNEHSGMNCASLGGWKSANSLEMNPFRQMRAMPVYCMNLPQFSNGFVYIFNEQELNE
ncbi:hypothetical protein ACHAXR_007610 [Thalassiosira sp. AJA248-18]